MAVSKVPAEILEIIFTFLDGPSFCSAILVCKSWCEVGKELQKKKWLWKCFCTKEIPTNILEELLSFKSIPQKDKIVNWMKIYKTWWSGKRTKHLQFSQKSVQAFYSDPITVIKISGSYVITGHISGVICIWNRYTGKLHERSQCHLKGVTDIALVDLLNHDSYGSEVIPWSHHHVITASKDFYIRISTLLEPFLCSEDVTVLKEHSDMLISIKVFGHKLAACSRNNTVTLWNMKIKTPFHLEIALLSEIIGPADMLLTLGFWYDEVKCITYGGRLKTFSSNTNSWIEKIHFKESYSQNGPESVVAVSAAFMFHNQIIMLLTTDGKLVISVDEKHCRHYHLMRILKTELVTLSLQGTILALGGENGKLFLYDIINTSMLKELDLSKPNSVIYLSEASIITIDIYYDLHSPIISAATTESIYIIEWIRSSNFHQDIKMRSMTSIF